MELLDKSNYTEMRWKNGGGSTLELYKETSEQIPDGPGFSWRLSIASVDTDGPFSHFPHTSRILLLLSGNGITLNNKLMTTLSDPLYFSGEETIYCALIDGPSRDFNVMCDERLFEPNLIIVEDTNSLELQIDGEIVVIHAIGSCSVNGIDIGENASIVLRECEAVRIGDVKGKVMVVRLIKR